jgi:hypothetical protein
VLYGIIREHLATFLAQTESIYTAPLPKYVVDTFEHYLACGDLARGFLRCHCDGCGHDVLVAFSCKARGICPSCGARRMCDEAAHLIDRVLPNVPIRQWVLSLPWELRGLAATRPDVLGAMDRIFAEEIARVTKQRTGIVGAATGAVSCPQRFGGALNVNPHLHTLCADGVFDKTDDGGVRFHAAPPPDKDDVVLVAKRVRERATRWLRRHHYLDERAAEEGSNEAPERSAIEACTQLALAGGAFLARPGEPQDNPDADLERRERRFSAAWDGVDVHCAVCIGAGDDQGRERLVRYCTRPPFAHDRISVLPEGRIAYRLKAPRRGRTHRVMTPMDFMARLASLIPPPKIPTVRYHGVFAPRSSWRALVTPKPRTRALVSKACPASASTSTTPSASTPAPVASSPGPSSPAQAAPAAPAAPKPASAPSVAASVPSSPTHASAEPVIIVDATTITVAHWGRLLDGELFATARYIDWATLLKRSFGFDALRCPRCTKRMRVLATITQPHVVRKILEHLGVRPVPLTTAPARDPTWDQVNLGFDADAG